jgi:hypothetical protein
MESVVDLNAEKSRNGAQGAKKKPPMGVRFVVGATPEAEREEDSDAVKAMPLYEEIKAMLAEGSIRDREAVEVNAMLAAAGDANVGTDGDASVITDALASATIANSFDSSVSATPARSLTGASTAAGASSAASSATRGTASKVPLAGSRSTGTLGVAASASTTAAAPSSMHVYVARLELILSKVQSVAAFRGIDTE